MIVSFKDEWLRAFSLTAFVRETFLPTSKTRCFASCR